MAYQFLIDFDGTIALTDTTDLLLRMFAGPEWLVIEEEWAQGKINSRECLARQANLLAASDEDIRRALATVEIDPHFPAFLAAARRAHASAQIISDGFDVNIATVLGARYADVPRRSNLLRRLAGGWSVLFPHARPHCEAGSGVCKCAAIDGRFPTVLIGDGRSDFCLAGRVDFVLAKGSLAAHCRQMGYEHRAIASFADAIAWLEHDALLRFPILDSNLALGSNNA